MREYLDRDEIFIKFVFCLFCNNGGAWGYLSVQSTKSIFILNKKNHSHILHFAEIE